MENDTGFRFRLLHDIDEAFAAGPSGLNAALALALSAIRTNLGAGSVSFYSYDPDQGCYLTLYHTDSLGWVEYEHAVYLDADPHSIHAVLLETDESVLVREEGKAAFFPLNFADQYLGYLKVNDETPVFLDPAVLVSYAMAVDALERKIPAFRDGLRQAEDIRILKAIAEISTRVIATMERSEILSIILKSAVEILGFDGAKLYIVSDDGRTVRGECRCGLNGVLEASEGEAYPIPEGRTAEESFPGMITEGIESPQIRALLKIVVLRTKTRALGFLSIHDLVTWRRLDDKILEYLKLLLNIAAVALENAKLYCEIESLSITDALTALANARQFRLALARETERLGRQDASISLLLMDIDDFKSHNDRYGHPGGDLLLKRFAATIKNAIRSVDLAARQGGDEFAVILIGTGLAEAKIVAHRILEAVKASPIEVGAERVCYSVSIGVGVASTGMEIDEEALIAQADAELYRAKALGKGRVSPD